ncbi:glycosyltransferase [candidate division KSB1 bacterium]|nr:glycosyltransferase [candidate division KSB1 bacterium]
MKNKPPKILHIDTGKAWRGGQQQVAYLFEGMLEKGLDTALVCQPDSELENYCKERTLPYFPLRMRGEIDIIAGLRIALLCRKLRFRILHLHTAHAMAIGLFAKLFYPTLKLIAVRRVDFHINKNLLSQLKYKTRLLDVIVCISDGIKKVLLEDGLPAEKLITIHSGIDKYKFKHLELPPDFRQQLGIPEQDVVVGTIAAIAGHKDYPNLLKTARIVLDKRENVTFCAVGEGPDEKQVFGLARDLQLGDRFIFTGFRKDLGSFLKMFDIFVLASKKEGLGTSILDAQAMGLPVVGCDTGGIPEAVKHEQNGLLVPPRNEQALADALLRLIDDSQLREQLGQTGRKTVEQFSIERTIKKNLKLYQKLHEE